MDRTIHFGDSETDARYRIQDTSSTGGDFVLAEDLDGGTVLLEYDYSASEWVSRGPVNLNGNDITNAGSISASSFEANSADTRNGYDDVSGSRSFNTTETNNTGADLDLAVIINVSTDGTSVDFDIQQDGTQVDKFKQTSDSGERNSVQATIPAGSTYEVRAFGDTGNYSITRWLEQT